jgi:hypothetical protein
VRFPGKGPKALRDRAAALGCTEQTEQTLRKGRRCVHGLDTSARCNNYQVAGTGFRRLPNDTFVLSHMGIHSAYNESWVCCPDHGHRADLPISKTNLAGRVSNHGRKRKAETPAQSSPTVRARYEESRPSLEERKAVQQDRVQQSEEIKEHESHVRDLKHLLDEASCMGEDAHDVMVQLLKDIEELRKRVQTAEEKEAEAVERADHLERWAKQIRPVDWESIDDAWVARWTGFPDKASAKAFFEAFVQPNLSNFQSWNNFVKHRLENQTVSDDLIAAMVTNLISPPGLSPTSATSSSSSSSPPSSSSAQPSPSQSPPPSSSSLPTTAQLKAMSARQLRGRQRNHAFRSQAGGVPVVDQLRPIKRGTYAYCTHGSDEITLTAFQEFLLYNIWIRRAMGKDHLALTFFGSAENPAVARVNSVIRTWASALYTILSKEDWWLPPSELERVRAYSNAFSVVTGDDVLSVADCTNVNCQSSNLSELVRQQLFSLYYKATCGKYLVAMSPIGGVTLVAPGQGGPAGDHQCMMAGDLFSHDKWQVPDGQPWPKLMYNAGVSRKTKTVANAASCDLVTSGIVRKSKDSALSALQRSVNFGNSSLRIRVENLIGIVKNRFKILKATMQIDDIGMMDKVVFTCFILHNFGAPTIK